MKQEESWVATACKIQEGESEQVRVALRASAAVPGINGFHGTVVRRSFFFSITIRYSFTSSPTTTSTITSYVFPLLRPYSFNLALSRK